MLLPSEVIEEISTYLLTDRKNYIAWRIVCKDHLQILPHWDAISGLREGFRALLTCSVVTTVNDSIVWRKYCGICKQDIDCECLRGTFSQLFQRAKKIKDTIQPAIYYGHPVLYDESRDVAHKLIKGEFIFHQQRIDHTEDDFNQQ